jgi:hypothetical protein
MSEPAWELPALEPVDFGELAIDIASWEHKPDAPFTSPDGLDQDGGILIPPPAGADEPPVWVDVRSAAADIGEELSSALSLLPIVGTVKDIIEVVTGDDLITGKPLSNRKIAFNIAAATADLIGFGIAGRVAKGGAKAVPIGVRVIKAIGDGAGRVNDAEDVGTLVF